MGREKNWNGPRKSKNKEPNVDRIEALIKIDDESHHLKKGKKKKNGDRDISMAFDTMKEESSNNITTNTTTDRHKLDDGASLPPKNTPKKCNNKDTVDTAAAGRSTPNASIRVPPP